MTKTIDESLDIIATALQLMIEEKKETNRLLDAITGMIENGISVRTIRI